MSESSLFFGQLAVNHWVKSSTKRSHSKILYGTHSSDFQVVAPRIISGLVWFGHSNYGGNCSGFPPDLWYGLVAQAS